jgi:2-polyprenyl-6-methoxyphenol hydroxylase-like FAD-dependent oxidoreductase
MAAEDAVVLAHCLRDAQDVPAALTKYEHLRRDRVERVVAWGSSMNNTKKQGLVGRALRDLALPVILRRAARPEELGKMSWLFNHHLEQLGTPDRA